MGDHMKILFLILFCQMTLNAYANHHGKKKWKDSPCRMEVDRLCGPKERGPAGRKARRSCMKENMKNFSPECQEKFKKKKKRRKHKLTSIRSYNF